MTFVTIMTILTHFLTSSTNVSLNKVNNNKNLMSTAIPDDSGVVYEYFGTHNLNRTFCCIRLIDILFLNDYPFYFV